MAGLLGSDQKGACRDPSADFPTHFQQLYRRILAERPLDWRAVAEDTADRRARAHSCRHIEAQLADVTEKLARLRAMGGGAGGR